MPWGGPFTCRSGDLEGLNLDLYNLGKVSWQDSQLVYHALAELGRESLVLLSPATPYVCVGYHQDVEEEVDLDFCQAHDIPVFRRELGGGAVYLDGDQFFFQLILHEKSPLIPAKKETFYRKFLKPVINTYRHIGIPAEYKPINDVIVKGRKICGSGVGEIGNSLVFVGNLILDFNFDMMSRILKVPDEKFRDKLYHTMAENMTTIRRELGTEGASKWDEMSLNNIMKEEFQKILEQEFISREKDDELQDKIKEMGAEMLSRKWLLQKGKSSPGREVKIKSGVKIIQRMHKASGGLIRAIFEVRDDCFSDVLFSGDFFCYPLNAVQILESMLKDRSTSDAPKILKDFYSDPSIEIAGITIDDWMKVLQD